MSYQSMFQDVRTAVDYVHIKVNYQSTLESTVKNDDW